MVVFSMKTISVRKVDEHRDERQVEEEGVEDCRRHVIIREQDDDDDGSAWTSLTVWRKSLVLSCEGFTVIDSNGGLAFRVDNYNERRPHQLTLMDASGNPLLTMRRPKKLRLMDQLWLVYQGEVGGRSSKKEKPIYCVRKHVSILQPHLDVLAEVYSGPSEKKRAYVIHGRYAERSCRVLDERRRQVVAEIKRKEPVNGGASFGPEVFLLIVRPGFSPAFAMAMVLLLDQMFS